MKRWNLKNIIIYSKLNERKIIDFNLTGITIITGKSRTGKSAISEIVDYTLGSSKCHLPILIRETCSWVGVVLKKENTEILILRKLPKEHKNSSSDFYIKQGVDIVIPETKDEISKVISLEEVKQKLECIFKIREVDNSFFENEYKKIQKISVRSIMPYLIQDDEIIISKSNILRGLNTDKRQSIIDAAPYFLGAVDEEYIQKKAKLTRLKKELTILEKKFNEANEYENERLNSIKELIVEAQQVGLVKKAEIESQHLKDILYCIVYDGLCNEQELLSYLDSEDSIRCFYEIKNKDIEENNLLDGLYDEIKAIDEKIVTVKKQIELTQSYLNDATDFMNTTNEYKSHFINLELRKSFVEKCLCPLCGNKVETAHDTINNMQLHMEQINYQIQGVEAERPKLDKYLLGLQNEYNRLKRDRNITKSKIQVLIKEDELQNEILEERQNKVKGKIEYFLSTTFVGSTNAEMMESINKLRKEINDLEEEISIQSINDKVQDVRLRINAYALEIINKLPLEEKYRDCPIDLNINNMTVGIVGKNGRVFMRDVGSDLNYLCLHVATLLAIHRHFDDIDREYPGFLLFDQLSRPFFPPDPKNDNNLDEIVIAAENEKKELKQFFDYLFVEVKKNPSLQIIILEHAYFERDPLYTKATKYRWDSEGLIPASWIQRVNDSY